MPENEVKIELLRLLDIPKGSTWRHRKTDMLVRVGAAGSRAVHVIFSTGRVMTYKTAKFRFSYARHRATE